MKVNTALLAIIIACGAVAAHAETIVFSGELSDYSEPDISVFAAAVNYSFDTSTNVLTVEVINGTSSPKDYTLSELFLNVSADVTGLSIVSKGGFNNASLREDEQAGGFGTFDYKFDFGQGNSGLAAGNTAVLTFLASGSDLDVSDFFSGYQVGGGADKGRSVAAIKFTQGPGDDSVYAITLEGTPVVPEPATLLLLGMGIAGMAARRFRKA